MLHLKRIDFTLQLQCYYTANSMLLEGKSNAFKTRLCSEWGFAHPQTRKSLRGFYWAHRKNWKERRQDVDVKETRSPS